jgi:hypothetical protein
VSAERRREERERVGLSNILRREHEDESKTEKFQMKTWGRRERERWTYM